MADDVELFSQEWCDRATVLWDEEIRPCWLEPERFNFTAEFETEGGGVSQFKAEGGKLVWWKPGKDLAPDDLDFMFVAQKDNWGKVATGKLDPVAALASQRVKMRKGPMEVVIREADAFKHALWMFGKIPTSW